MLEGKQICNIIEQYVSYGAHVPSVICTLLVVCSRKWIVIIGNIRAKAKLSLSVANEASQPKAFVCVWVCVCVLSLTRNDKLIN